MKTRKRYVGVLLIAFLLFLAAIPPAAAQGGEMRVLGWLGGSIGAIWAEGDRAYAGVGPSLVVLNMSDPFQLRELGQTDRLADLVEGIAVHGDYAFLACRFDGLHVVDISDAANPHEVAQLPGSGFTRDLAVREDPESGQVLAYVAEQDWLRIVDVTQPLSPTLVSEVHGNGFGVDIAVLEKADHTYAYVAARWYGLRVYDVTAAASPTLVSSLPLPSAGNSLDGLAVTQDRLYAAGQGGVWAFDLTDPAAPVETNHVELTMAQDVLLAEGRLYIAADSQGLMAVDVGDEPWSLLGPWNIGGGQAMELAFAQGATGSSVLVSLGHSVVAVDPAGPEAIGSYHGLEAWAVDALPGYAYVVDGLGMQIVDVSDPSALEVVGVYTGTQPAQRVVALERQGRRYAFVVGAGGLRIVDVTDPAASAFVAHVPVASPKDVAVRGNYAYLADFDGLAILDVADLAHPVEVGRFATSVPARVVTVFQEAGGQGRTLGCLVEGGNLHVLDLTDPAHPAELATREMSIGCYSMVVQGTVAYLALGVHGVTEVDLSNPARPRDGACSAFQSSGWVYDLAVQGRYLYTVGNQGAQVFDMTKGCWASPVAHVPAAEMEGMQGLRVVDDIIYAADPYGGLAVLEYAIPRWSARLPLLLK